MRSSGRFVRTSNVALTLCALVCPGFAAFATRERAGHSPVEADRSSLPTVTRTGSRKKKFASRWTAPGHVALIVLETSVSKHHNRTTTHTLTSGALRAAPCFVCPMITDIIFETLVQHVRRLTSSNTRYSTTTSTSPPLCMRSRMHPGVPTTTCAPLILHEAC